MSADFKNIGPVKTSDHVERAEITESETIEESKNTAIVQVADPNLLYGLGKKKPPAKEDTNPNIINASIAQAASARESEQKRADNNNSSLDKLRGHSTQAFTLAVNSALENSDNFDADLAWTENKAIPVEAYKELTLS